MFEEPPPPATAVKPKPVESFPLAPAAGLSSKVPPL
jgi:hypothetical protein